MKGICTKFLCSSLIVLLFVGLSGNLMAQAWNPGTATPATNIDRSGNAEIGLTTTILSSSTSNTKLQVNGGEVSYGSHFSSKAGVTVDGSSAEGNATSYGGRAASWFSNGALIGIQGSVNADRVRTTTPSRSGFATGGNFTLNINDPIPSGNANSGPYQIAGSVSQLSGNITTYPGTGFVAAVAGIDNIKGTETWGGYFDGRGYFSENVGIGTDAPITRMDVRGGNVFVSPNATAPFPNQFTALGSSFGACDIYGFRSQFSTDLSINVGIEDANTPTISWANTSGDGDLDFDCDVDPGGCGELIARMSCAGPYAFSVFGTGFFSGGTFTPSDRNLKSEINELKDPMDIIRALRGVTYTYNNEVWPEYKFPAAQQVGFIAQEVKEVIPEAVKVDRNGLHGVNYEMVIPYLVEGMQELDEQEQIEDARITALENEVAELKEMIRDLCNNNGEAQLKAGEGASDVLQGDVPVLFQNVPNPFNTSTKINYYLPTSQGQGQVLVRDLTGNTVLSFVVEPGRGAVEVPASALSGGTYLYSLVVNGEAVATRRLSITK